LDESKYSRLRERIVYGTPLTTIPSVDGDHVEPLRPDVLDQPFHARQAADDAIA
jgi:hypothetical protein